MQHASTAVNVRALRKLITFCGGQFKDPQSGEVPSTTDCSYLLVGDRASRRGGNGSTANVADTGVASKRLSLEDFLALAAGDSNGIDRSKSGNKRQQRYCAEEALRKSKKTRC